MCRSIREKSKPGSLFMAVKDVQQMVTSSLISAIEAGAVAIVYEVAISQKKRWCSVCAGGEQCSSDWSILLIIFSISRRRK